MYIAGLFKKAIYMNKSCKNIWNPSWFISNSHYCLRRQNEKSEKTEVLSDQIEWAAPILAINLRSAKMKGSAFKELVTSMRTSRLEKQVKKVP